MVENAGAKEDEEEDDNGVKGLSGNGQEAIRNHTRRETRRRNVPAIIRQPLREVRNRLTVSEFIGWLSASGS